MPSPKELIDALMLVSYIKVFLFQNHPKNLDPSCKMDLDYWDCFGKGKTHLNQSISVYFCVMLNGYTVKTLNIGTPRPATVVVLNIKQFNFTMK